MRWAALPGLVVGLAVTGCQYGWRYEEPPRMIAVQVEIRYPAAVGRRPVLRTVEVPYGGSVMDATRLAATETGSAAPLDDWWNDGGYAARMGSVVVNERWKRNGWVYTVNGAHPSPPPEGMPLVDGDVIVWTYNPR